MFGQKEKNVQVILSVTILVISLFMSIGFAAAGNITLNINNTSLTKAPTEPFISSATLSGNVGANTSGTNVTTGDNTFANFNVSLSTSNASSSATYTMTLYNPTDKEYMFDDVLYELGSTTYSNENIVFDLSGISSGDTISPGTGKTFNITFHYKNNTLPSVKTLKALLNFRVYSPNFLSRDWGILAGFKTSSSGSRDIAYSDAEIHKVRSLTFYSNGSSFSGTPIDVSEKQDGSILLYKIASTYNNTSAIIYDLKICSNSIIDFPIDSSYLFAYYWYLTIDFNNSVNTSNVTNMSHMFEDYDVNVTGTCTVDVSNFNTSNVTNMLGMFSSACYSSQSFSLNVSNFDTSKVTDMSHMFSVAGYRATTWSLSGISNFDTSNVTNMNVMFYKASYSTQNFSLNLSNFDTSKVTDMGSMFCEAGYNATTWSIIGISNWNTSQVIYMYGMFESAGYNATNFTLDLSGWNTSNVTNMNNMFSNTGYNSTTLVLGIGTWNTSRVTNMNEMFASAGYNATSFQLNLSSWNISNVHNTEEMFLNCRKLTKIYISSNWTFMWSNDSDDMFKGAVSLPNYNSSYVDKTMAYSECDGGYLTIIGEVCPNYLSRDWAVKAGIKSSYSSSSSINDIQSVTFYSNGSTFSGTPVDVSQYQDGSILLYKVLNASTSKYDLKFVSNDTIYFPFDSSYLFAQFRYLNSINFNNSINTSNTSNMSYMFYYDGYSSGTNYSLDISSFNTNKVTNMSYMFRYNTHVNQIYIGYEWTVKNVTSSSYMFGNDTLLPNYNSSYVDKAKAKSTCELGYLTIAGEVCPHFLANNWKLTAGTSDLQSITFYSNGSTFSGTPIDVSQYQDGSILLYKVLDSNTNKYDFKIVSDAKIYFPVDSSELFSDFSYLNNIDFNHSVDSSKVVDMSNMFYRNGTFSSTNYSLDLSDFDTSNVTNMEDMFRSNSNLKKIYVGFGWDVSGVTNSRNMFYDAVLLPNYDLSYTDKSRAKSMCDGGYLTMIFDICTNYLSHDWGILAGLKTSNTSTTSSINDIQSITFYNNGSTFAGTPIDVSKFQDDRIFLYKVLDSNTNKYDLKISSNETIYFPVDSSYILSKFPYITNINFNNSIDTSDVTNMSYMFYYNGTSSTVNYTLDLSSFDISSVTNMSYMFGTNPHLTRINIDSEWNLDNVTSSSSMFLGSTLLPNYDSSSTNKTKAISMCDNGYLTIVGEVCPNYLSTNWGVLSGYKSLSTSSSAVNDVQSITFYKDGRTFSGTPIDISQFGDNRIFLYKILDTSTNKYDLKICSNSTILLPPNSSYLFAYYYYLKNINFNNSVNTSGMTNMSYMFSYSGYNTTIFELDLSVLDTSRVTNMSYAFWASGFNATTWNIGNISNWNVSNVTSMSYMFASAGHGATSFSLDLGGWNTINVTNMTYMFSNAGYYATNWSIENINNWNTSKLRSTDYMFNSAGYNAQIFELDLNSWDTSEVIYMPAMFFQAGYNSSLFELDLSGWNTSNVTSMASMFQSCRKLSKIYVGENWSTESIIYGDNIFSNCTSLVGGNGTIYDSSHINVEYAKIDGDGGPGYLTNKNSGPFVITVSSNDTNKGTVSGSGTYNLSQNATLTATPKTSNSFLGWYENNKLISTSNPYVFKVVKNKNIVGEFRTSSTLTLTNANPTYGSITGSGTYAEGSEVTITASSNTGYKFTGWYDGSNNLISNQKNYTFTMPASNLSYTAKFVVYVSPTWTLAKASGASYEFIQNSSGYYESNNKGIHSSAAVSVITVDVPSNGTTIDLHCINYAENNYDYGLIGVLDGTLTTTSTSDTNVAKSFKGLNQSTEQVYSFTGVSAGTHTIYIKFRKDSSGSSYNDSLQFKVGFDGNDPIDAE